MSPLERNAEGYSSATGLLPSSSDSHVAVRGTSGACFALSPTSYAADAMTSAELLPDEMSSLAESDWLICEGMMEESGFVGDAFSFV